MNIIPVIDIRDGIVVHARGGERANYQPLKSLLTQSVKLEQVIDDLLAWYPFKQLYIADLDAIFAVEGDARGEQVAVPTPGIDGYSDRGLRLGFAYGDFEGANALGLSLGYRFTGNLSAELRAAQTIGAYSDSQTYQVALLHQPFPQWRLSPYFLLGTGINITSPNATIVATEDRQDTTMLTGIGVKTHLSRRFALRAEVANHYLLTSRENNQEIVEWKLGFDVFM